MPSGRIVKGDDEVVMNNKADFVIENKEVKQPDIVSDDSLALYYDTKGKTNTDYHKSTLLDMSGNGKHGKLHNFAYENLSGYTDEGGLMFDGVDDTLERASIDDIEIVRWATNNLFSKEIWDNSEKVDSNGVPRIEIKVDPNTTYTVSTNATIRSDEDSSSTMPSKPFVYAFNSYQEASSSSVSGNHVQQGLSRTVKTNSDGIVRIAFHQNYYDFNKHWILLEKGSSVTPNIPTAKMTYQLNNNIISYGEGGTIRWVKDGKVMERKGINIIRNGNFWNGADGWQGDNFEVVNGKLVLKGSTTRYYQHIIKSRAFDSNSVVYMSAVVQPKNDIDSMFFQSNDGLGNRIFGRIRNLKKNQTYLVEGLYEPRVGHTSNRINVQLYHSNSNGIPIDAETIIYNIQAIDLTATFGAGNEPTLEEIQADPDKWQWLPNPMDLLEAKELEGNILGDLEDVVDAEVRDQQSGKGIYTDKADDSVVHVDVDGKSYQHTQEGNSNLLINSNFSRDIITYDKRMNVISRGHNQLTFSNQAHTNTGPGFEFKHTLSPDKKYTLSFDLESSGDAIYNYIYLRHAASQEDLSMGGSLGVQVPSKKITKGDNRVEITFDGSENANGIWLGINASLELILTMKNLKLEEGSVATPQNKPTPDYPSEIESLNDFDVVSSVGKENLFTNSSIERTGRREFLNSSDWDMAPIFDKFGTDIEYTISFDLKSAVSGVINVYAQNGSNTRYRIGVHRLQATTDYKRFSITFKPTFSDSSVTRALLAFFGQAYDSGIIPTVRNVKMEIGRGSGKNQYIPSPTEITKDNNHPLIDKINLSLSEPLRSAGDAKDRLFRDSDGLWKIERKFIEYQADGSENWSYHNTFERFDMSRSIGADTGAIYNGMNSHFLSTRSSNNDKRNITWVYKGVPRVTHHGVSSSTELKSYMKNQYDKKTPVTWIMEKVTPTIETLDQELQDKLNSLRSFQDSNYVYTIINDKTDNLSPVVRENLKPTLHTEFLAKDYLKENRTINNLLMWDRPLNDDELLHQNRLFHRRFNFRSDMIKGEPVVWNVSLLNGGVYAHSLEQNYTIEI